MDVKLELGRRKAYWWGFNMVELSSEGVQLPNASFA